MKTLKEKYLEYGLKYSQAFKAIFEDKVENKDYRKFSNLEKRSSKKCHEIFEELKKLNRLNEIEDLMFHNDPYVRYIAASHCLFCNTKTAEKVLENLIETNDHKIQTHALMGLKAWRKIPWSEDRYK
jgi:hypothetical protein